MSNGRHEHTSQKIDFQIFMVLADPHLPSLVPLASTTPAFEHRLANGTPHKLNGSDKARHRLIIRTHQ
jgi:hypothetical protein